jgi:hypothetical protein
MQNELQDYELGKREWTITKQLCDILKVGDISIPRIADSSTHFCCMPQVLKDMTLFFLCSTLSLAMVIPAIDFINDKLTAHAHDWTLSPAIKASLELGKKTLNHYYLLTDSLEAYCIAMGTWLPFLVASHFNVCQSVLHLRHKLSYFKLAGWEQDWIETAKELVCDTFERSYKQGDARDEYELLLAQPTTGTKVQDH